MRVANIYDVNAKTYLFKLARPEDKVFLVIESGIRAHTTAFSREKNIMPSQFSMKVKPPSPPGPLHHNSCWRLQPVAWPLLPQIVAIAGTLLGVI